VGGEQQLWSESRAAGASSSFYLFIFYLILCPGSQLTGMSASELWGEAGRGRGKEAGGGRQSEKVLHFWNWFSGVVASVRCRSGLVWQAPPLGTYGSLGPWNDCYKDCWMV